MSVNIELSSFFGLYTNNVLTTKVEGKTVRECLHNLVKQFPKMKRLLLDNDGNLMRTYDYFINGASVYPKDMNAPLKNGDKLNLLYVIHGG
jgi:molybdopterin converting factor small subunit